MTYGDLKNQIAMLLIGDNDLPKDEAKVLAGLKFAYIELADISTPLKWLTLNKDVSIMRQGPGSYWVRMPDMPLDTTDELDIDSELTPALARFMASNIAKEIQMKNYHRRLGSELLKKYDAKVREYILNQESKGAYADA